VLDKIVTAVNAQMQDDGALREQLLEAQMRLELGEIDEAEFKAIESDVLTRIREIKSQQGPLVMSSQDHDAGIEIETFESKD
jgi:Gas vesicle protein G